MQLVYLLIDGYCNFHQAEFNFNPQLRLHFNQDKTELEVLDTKFRYPVKFWGENINNLSIIVGSNGAGKTSLMQAIISLFLENHGQQHAGGKGILVFQENDTLYGYQRVNRPVAESVQSEIFKHFKWVDRDDVEPVLGRTKLIYLTNVLNMRDYQRSQWYPNDRYAPLYDCSMGNLLISNASKDVNLISRSGSMELEAYLLYEQYKQIKFVFDKHQHQICVDLKEKGYPMPLPEKLYINLMLKNYLSSVLDDDDFDLLDDLNVGRDFAEDETLDRNVFPDLYSIEREQQHSINYDPDDSYTLLRKQLSRCAIWCVLRSAARMMPNDKKRMFKTWLWEWKPSVSDYTKIFEEAWKFISSILRQREDLASDLQMLKKYYLVFHNFIQSERLENHFHMEQRQFDMFDPDYESITFSVDTSDTDWFMEFLQKYRYICNPDYFLDFHWGLSSGENSLLSLFASFYYIFGQDYTDPRRGGYQILNKFPQSNPVQCDSVVLLIDEADLTYHPEWQRVFIDLLTAVLPRIYSPQCCRDIQIILSTHSPILLSDVPQQSVIYLKPDSDCKTDGSLQSGTFGQNIHLLFKDSFFLTRGTIGCFAERKIKCLLEELNKIKQLVKPDTGGKAKSSESAPPLEQIEKLREHLEQEVRPLAELIAEPIIRRKALMMINELEQELSQNDQDDWPSRLTDEELALQFERIKGELHRRNNDTNFDI